MRVERVVVSSLMGLFMLGGFTVRPADRCADARDDILRARGMAGSGQAKPARTLLVSAFMACPGNSQNLDLLAETYDTLGDLVQAGKYREQAMRLRGQTGKPVMTFTSSAPSIARGETATLTWSTSFASEVEIVPDIGRVPAKGSKEVAPSAAATYQLAARGPGGSTTATVEIAVTIPRLTIENILDLLKSEVPQARIAKFASERGITFVVSRDTEERLKAAGAEEPLLDALKTTPK